MAGNWSRITQIEAKCLKYHQKSTKTIKNQVKFIVNHVNSLKINQKPQQMLKNVEKWWKNPKIHDLEATKCSNRYQNFFSIKIEIFDWPNIFLWTDLSYLSAPNSDFLHIFGNFEQCFVKKVVKKHYNWWKMMKNIEKSAKIDCN